MYIYIFTNLSYRALSGHLCVPQAGTTCGLRSFLVANSTQNYFLVARILSFCDIHDKSAVVNILQQNMTIYLHRKWIDRKHIKRK